MISDFDKKRKQQKHKKEKKPKIDKEEPILSTSTYRDRAKERREGINQDFEPQQLGGDIKYTHLVKGVDFALLEKVKSAQKLTESIEANSNHGLLDDVDHLLAGSDSDEEEYTREAIRAATATTSNKRQMIDLEKLRKSEMIQCRTALARRILNALDDEKWQVKSELFQPGRMSYVFSLDDDSDTQVTTILRSKAEQAEGEMPVSEKDLAFDQLINIFAKIRNKKI
mgnify:CR=1 FL=1